MLGVARATGSQTIAQGQITIFFCSGTIFFIPEQIFSIARTIKKLFQNKIPSSAPSQFMTGPQ